MTRNEYLNLAGEYCIKMEWNHDAIPELAECLEAHDKNMTRFLEGEKIARQYAIDKGVELQRHNFLLMQAGNALRDALAFEGVKIGDLPREIKEWEALVSALPNVV
jgi:hypothetical protein